jgi:hypothetical protein
MDGALAPLLALVGHCFTGQFAPGTRDEHCFTSVYGGQHVRDVQVVSKDGRAVYQGETIYSVEGKGVSFLYLSSIGGIGRGTVAFAPGDWRFTMTMRASPTAAPQPSATRWQWQGNSAYSVSGGPAPVTYRRTAKR